MSDFPTLGLKFDLTDIVKVRQVLQDTQTQLLDTGQRALELGKSADKSAAGMKAQAQQAKQLVAELALVRQALKALELQQKAEQDAAAAAAGAQDRNTRNLMRRMQEAADFQKRMDIQKASSVRDESRAFEAATRDVISAMNLRSRLANQRANEEAATARAEAQRIQNTQRIIGEAMEFGLQMQRNQTRSAEALSNQRARAIEEEARRIQAAYRLAEGEARRSGRSFTTINTGQVVNQQQPGPGLGALVGGIFGVGSSANTATGATNGFIGALQNLGRSVRSVRLTLLDARFAIGAMVAAMTLGPVAEFADQMTALEARTRLYAARQSDIPFLLEKTFETAQAARAPLEGVAQLYTRLAPLADRLHRSQSQLLDIVGTVSKAFTIGGAKAEEATAAAQQFAQALSSNRFGGDELRSVAENAPALLQAIAEGVNQINPKLNLNAATFIKWAQAGNANSALLVKALENARAKIDAMFKTMPVTVGQGLTVLKNAVTQAIGEIDKLASSNGTRLSVEVGAAIAKFAQFADSKQFIEGVAGALKATVAVAKALGEAVGFLTNHWRALATALAAILVARTVVNVFTLLNSTISGVSGATYVMAQAMNVGRTALAALLSPMTLITIAVAAATAAYLYFADAHRVLAETGGKLQADQEDLLSGFDRAANYVKTYGIQTTHLDTAMGLLAATTGQVAKATGDKQTADEKALAVAIQRANAERQVTKALYEQKAVDASKSADDAEKALKKSAQIDFGLGGVVDVFKGKFGQEALDQREIAFAKEHVQDVRRISNLREVAKSYQELAKVYKDPLTAAQVTAVTPGDGNPKDLPGKPDKSLEKRLATLQGEIDKSHAIVAQLKSEGLARAALADATQKFYSGGLKDLDGYVAALRASSIAELAAKKLEEAKAVAALQDGKAVGTMTQAEKDKVAVLIRSKEAELDLKNALDQRAKATSTREEIEEQIAANDNYTASITRTAKAIVDAQVALAAYNIVKQSNGAIGAQDAISLARRQIESEGRKTGADRIAQFNEELRLAALSTKEAEQEGQVRQRALEIQSQNTKLSEGEAQAQARIALAIEKRVKDYQDLKREVKDIVQQSFVNDGKIDFGGVKNAFKRAIRQSIYEALIQKPIDIVVNAVVDVVTKGLDQLLSRILGAKGSDGTETGLGKVVDNSFSKLGASLKNVFAKLPTDIQGALSAGGEVLGYAAIGNSLAKAVGLGGKNKTNGEIGAGVGSAAGFAIAGPIGAVIGAILGTIGGGALGPRPTNAGAGVGFGAGGQLVISGDKRTADTEQAATAAAKAILEGLKALPGLGINAKNTITGLVLGVRDPSTIYTQGGGSLTAARGDAADAANVALRYILQGATYVNDAQKQLVESMIATGTAFDDIVAKLQAYKDAQDLYKSVDRDLLKFKDPQAYALANLQDQQLDRRRQFISYRDQGLLSPEQIAVLDGKLKELEKLEIGDAMKQFVTSVDGATASLDQLQEAQKRIAAYVQSLKVGALSPLSPEQQLTQAGNNFFKQLTQAKGGDLGALQDITNSSDSYLQQAQSFYGSSPAYASIFQTVTDALDQLGTLTFADPTVDAINKAVDDLTKAIDDNFLNLVDTVSGGATSTDIADLNTAITDGFTNLTTTIGSQTEAIVNATSTGFGDLSSVLSNSNAFAAALGGGRIAA